MLESFFAGVVSAIFILWLEDKSKKGFRLSNLRRSVIKKVFTKKGFIMNIFKKINMKRLLPMIIYLVVLLIGVASWYIWGSGSAALMGYVLVWIYGIIPLCTVILCSIIIASPAWKGKRDIAVTLPIWVYIIYPLFTVTGTINTQTMATLNSVAINVDLLGIGLGVTLISWIVGLIVRFILKELKGDKQ
jgi:hypothetical protein